MIRNKYCRFFLANEEVLGNKTPHFIDEMNSFP